MVSCEYSIESLGKVYQQGIVSIGIDYEYVCEYYLHLKNSDCASLQLNGTIIPRVGLGLYRE